MAVYIVRRLGQSIIVLVLASIMAFLLIYATGDPARALMPFDTTRQDIERTRVRLGLDKPLFIQYMIFVRNAVQGDLGESFRYRSSVISVVLPRLPATFALACSSFLIAAVISIPLGILCATRRNTVSDYLGSLIALLTISTPSFWIGIMLILLFASWLRWLPASGRGGIRHLILPAITLSFHSMGLLARVVRASMLDEFGQAYIVTARSKGLTEKVINFRHVLKNASIPIVTILGLRLGEVIGGTVVVETVFAWPGIGWLMMESIVTRDLPVIRAIVLVMAVLFVFINLTVDILYTYLDPRVRYE